MFWKSVNRFTNLKSCHTPFTSKRFLSQHPKVDVRIHYVSTKIGHFRAGTVAELFSSGSIALSSRWCCFSYQDFFIHNPRLSSLVPGESKTCTHQKFLEFVLHLESNNHSFYSFLQLHKKCKQAFWCYRCSGRKKWIDLLWIQFWKNAQLCVQCVTSFVLKKWAIIKTLKKISFQVALLFFGKVFSVLFDSGLRFE